MKRKKDRIDTINVRIEQNMKEALDKEINTCEHPTCENGFEQFEQNHKQARASPFQFAFCIVFVRGQFSLAFDLGRVLLSCDESERQIEGEGPLPVR